MRESAREQDRRMVSFFLKAVRETVKLIKCEIALLLEKHGKQHSPFFTSVVVSLNFFVFHLNLILKML